MMRDIARGLFVLAAVFLACGMMAAWKSLGAGNVTLSVLVFMIGALILAFLGAIFLTLEKP